MRKNPRASPHIAAQSASAWDGIEARQCAITISDYNYSLQSSLALQTGREDFNFRLQLQSSKPGGITNIRLLRPTNYDYRVQITRPGITMAVIAMAVFTWLLAGAELQRADYDYKGVCNRTRRVELQGCILTDYRGQITISKAAISRL